MTGFDNYIPTKWLDGILSVAVMTAGKVRQVKTSKPVFRKGQWVSKGLVAATLAVGGVFCSGLEIQPFSIAGYKSSSIVIDAPRLVVDAPAGYMVKLASIVKKIPRLEAQSIEFDPPVFI